MSDVICPKCKKQRVWSGEACECGQVGCDDGDTLHAAGCVFCGNPKAHPVIRSRLITSIGEPPKTETFDSFLWCGKCGSGIPSWGTTAMWDEYVRRVENALDYVKHLSPGDRKLLELTDHQKLMNVLEAEARALGPREAQRKRLEQLEAVVGGLRPEVIWFAQKMEERLAANDDKGGWGTESDEYLIKRIKEETEELEVAINSQIADEAADVANFAMMIADNNTPRRPMRARMTADPPGPDRQTILSQVVEAKRLLSTVQVWLEFARFAGGNRDISVETVRGQLRAIQTILAGAGEPQASAARVEHDRDYVAEKLMLAFHLYGGYKVNSRGPSGLLLDAIGRVRPDVSAALRESGDAGDVYERFFGEEDEPEEAAPPQETTPSKFARARELLESQPSSFATCSAVLLILDGIEGKP